MVMEGGLLSDDPDPIMQLMNDWIEALLAGDAEAMAEIQAEMAELMAEEDPGGEPEADPGEA
jgi:ketosteroid isomerase-like protein